MTDTKPLRGWHLLRANGLTRYSDELVTVGTTLHHSDDLPLVACEQGYHFSINLLDALRLSPNGDTVLCRVESSDDYVRLPDKVVTRDRTCLAMLSADATRRLCVTFACHWAEKAIELSHPGTVDPDSREAVAVVRRWLDGEATAEDIRAADNAAQYVVDVVRGRNTYIAHAALSTVRTIKHPNNAAVVASDSVYGIARSFYEVKDIGKEQAMHIERLAWDAFGAVGYNGDPD